MIVLIDNGHGVNTAGKCSPDHRLKEYKYARTIAKLLQVKLEMDGIDARLITPEDHDTTLVERVRRINQICDQVGKDKCIVVSIHNDAKSDDGTWHSACGFSARVGTKAGASSKQLAKMFTEHAKKLNIMGNRCTPTEGYWVQNLFICNQTKCPAVLTENLFMDNKADVDFLLSDKGMETITQLHYNAIKEYIRK